MPVAIPTGPVHHLRLTVADVARSRAFYEEVLGFTLVMELTPGVFLTNGSVGLGLGPHPDAATAPPGDRFDENRIGLDHLSFAVADRAALEAATAALDARGVPRGDIKDLGPDFGLHVLAFRDPDNVQLELSAPYPQLSATSNPQPGDASNPQ
jgi:glyoxylase I family protein